MFLDVLGLFIDNVVCKWYDQVWIDSWGVIVVDVSLLKVGIIEGDCFELEVRKVVMVNCK